MTCLFGWCVREGGGQAGVSRDSAKFKVDGGCLVGTKLKIFQLQVSMSTMMMKVNHTILFLR